MDAKSQVRRFREPPHSYDFHRDEFLRQLISLHCPNLSFAQTYTKYAYAPGNRKLKEDIWRGLIFGLTGPCAKICRDKVDFACI